MKRADRPCLVIAEAGVNHDGDPAKARALVDAAAASGADVVKFQSFVPRRLVVRSAPRAPYQQTDHGAADQASLLEPLMLARDTEVALAAYCRDVGIEFMSSPFDIESLDHLTTRCGVRRLKLGSGEITHGALLLHAARSGLPVIVSTGMSTVYDVSQALDVLAYGLLHPAKTPDAAQIDGARGDAAAALAEQVTLLHCNSAYPTPMSHANVRAMETLQSCFGLRCGYSDHTVGPWATLAAVARGAVVVEKHLTLDANARGPDHSASMEPKAFSNMVTGIRAVEASQVAEVKTVTSSEAPQREVARRSLVARRDVRAGEIWDAQTVEAKRPGTGMNPLEVFRLHGQRATRDYRADEALDPAELRQARSDPRAA